MPIDIAQADAMADINHTSAQKFETQLATAAAPQSLTKKDKQSMTALNEIIQVLEEKSAAVDPFDKKIKLVLDGHAIVINGYTSPLTIETENTEGEVDVKATTSIEDFSKILQKKINVQMAMMSGKIKIEGNMVAAVPLMKLL